MAGSASPSPRAAAIPLDEQNAPWLRDAAGAVHLYRDISRGATTTFRRTVRIAKNSLVIETEGDSEKTVNYCMPDGRTLRWECRDEAERFQAVAVREQQHLTITVSHDTEVTETTVGVAEIPWLQPLSYALGPGVRPLDTPLIFHMLRPDTMELVRLKAEHSGHEVIHIAGFDIQAVRIRVAPDGRLLGALCYAFYWFRDSDGLFVRYEGPLGLPGRDRHVVEWLPSGEDPASPETAAPASRGKALDAPN